MKEERFYFYIEKGEYKLLVHNPNTDKVYIYHKNSNGIVEDGFVSNQDAAKTFIKNNFN